MSNVGILETLSLKDFYTVIFEDENKERKEERFKKRSEVEDFLKFEILKATWGVSSSERRKSVMKERLRMVEDEIKAANELFIEIAEKSELLLKLREMSELVKAWMRDPEVKQMLVGLIEHRA